MTSKKLLGLFLLSFLFIGFGCHTENAATSHATNPAHSDDSAKEANTSSASVASVASPAVSVPVTPPVVNPVVAPGQWFDGWYQDADGYGKAVEEYKRTHQSMVVYVHVGWCPYCRKFEKDVLSSPLVQDFLKDKIKVSINPEAGRRENAIASQYGVRGFPSFFLHPPQPAHAVQLYTGVPPEDFIKFFKEALEG